MPEETKYDAIIIGTGQGGKPLAGALASDGWNTAVIEQKYVGGSCINYGCTPTKTMVASARAAYMAHQAGELGVNVSNVSVNLPDIVKRKESIVKSFRESGRKSLMETDNLDLIFGQASFVDKYRIKIDLNNGGSQILTSDHIIINTGAKPVIPPINGLDSIDYLDSTLIMELQDLPEHLIVLGGGYVGLEFGQMFRRFGSNVTIIQRADQLLSREDSDVAQEIASILEDEGIEILLQSEATEVEKSGSDIRVTVDKNGKETHISGSHLLIAVGRKPNTEPLNLQAAKIETDQKGNILVNDRLETNITGVYAIGDAKPGPMFTHISYDDYRILEANLLKNGDATILDRMVPYTVFMDPQLGRVGMTEKEAKQKGIDIRVAKLPMSYVSRAIETNETRGFIKVLVDSNSERILGCAALCDQGGEIMAMLQIAMMGDLPYTRLKNAILTHPTYAEALNSVFFALE